jgi:hypothetical protein
VTRGFIAVVVIDASFHQANGSTFSRKLREQNVASVNYHCARLDGCNVLLAAPGWGSS